MQATPHARTASRVGADEIHEAWKVMPTDASTASHTALHGTCLRGDGLPSEHPWLSRVLHAVSHDPQTGIGSSGPGGAAGRHPTERSETAAKRMGHIVGFTPDTPRRSPVSRCARQVGTQATA